MTLQKQMDMAKNVIKLTFPVAVEIYSDLYWCYKGIYHKIDIGDICISSDERALLDDKFRKINDFFELNDWLRSKRDALDRKCAESTFVGKPFMMAKILRDISVEANELG